MEGRPLDRSGESLLEHAARLRKLAARLVADPSMADDLVQDTYVAALRHAPAADRSLEPWLARVIGNFARKSRRSAIRREDRERALPPLAQQPTPDAIAERLEVQRTLIEALDELADPFRSTLVLHYFEGLSSAEIARLQHVPSATVRWRHQRGLDELREKLDRRFGGSRAAWCLLFAPLARPDLASIPSGVLAMSAASKILAVSLAAAAVAGVIWWQLDLPEEQTAVAAAHEREAPEPEAAGAPKVEPDGPVEAPEGRQPARASTAAAPATEAAEPRPAAGTPLRMAVEARFLDANGSPWEGVRLSTVQQVQQGGAAEAISGSDGHAQLEIPGPFEPGESRHYQLSARRDGCATVTLAATLHAGEVGHLGDVVLHSAVTLFGRVVDPSGKGIDGAYVGFAPEDLGDEDDDYLRRQGSEQFSPGTSVQSDANGAFALPGVAAGSWRVWGKAEETRFNWTDPLEITGDQDVYGLELVLTPYLDTDRLAGRVVDPKGKGVPKAEIYFHYQSERESGTTSNQADEEGFFRFVVQRPVAYTILATDPRGVWADSVLEKLPPGSLEIVLELGDRKQVEITVRDPDQEPIEDVRFRRLIAHPSRDDPAATETLSPGHYRVAIPNCSFSMQVSARGFRTQELGPFQPSSIAAAHEVTMERLPIVHGRVTAGGKGVPGARVSLVRIVRVNREWNGFSCVMDSEPTATVVADGDGRYEVGCELGDEFWVRASAKTWTDAERGPLKPPRGELEVDLELTHGGSIEGRVILPDGKNAEGTIVGINHGDGRARTQRAGPQGRYRFDGLTPGMWQVVRAEQEIRPDSITVREDDEEPKEIVWSCEVKVGRTTTFDLDLTGR
ncbi:MAG: sigma-70 family RNA polymerase sigma factor [Planctomycetota bacterium]